MALRACRLAAILIQVLSTLSLLRLFTSEILTKVGHTQGPLSHRVILYGHMRLLFNTFLSILTVRFPPNARHTLPCSHGERSGRDPCIYLISLKWLNR